jgi:hypothetical protein
MGANCIRLIPDTLRSAAGGSWGTYQTLGTALAKAARIVKFTNNGTVDVFVSWDGTNNHEILPMGSFLLLDVASNKQLANTLYIRAGTQFYVKSVSGAAGAASDVIYLSVYRDDD